MQEYRYRVVDRNTFEIAPEFQSLYKNLSGAKSAVSYHKRIFKEIRNIHKYQHPKYDYQNWIILKFELVLEEKIDP